MKIRFIGLACAALVLAGIAIRVHLRSTQPPTTAQLSHHDDPPARQAHVTQSENTQSFQSGQLRTENAETDHPGVRLPKVERLIEIKNNPPDRQSRLLALSQLYTLLEKEGRLESYAQTLEDSLSGNARDKHYLEELVILYASPSLKNEDKEYQYLKNYVEYGENSRALIRLAQYEAKKGNTLATYDLASEAATMNPSKATSHRLDGALFMENSDADRASLLCREVVRDPESPMRGVVIAGETLLRMKKYDEALQAFERILAKDAPITLRQRSVLGKCEIQIAKGNADMIVADLEQLSDTALSQAVRNMARALLDGMKEANLAAKEVRR